MWWGSGFITQIIYATINGSPFSDSHAILAENGNNIFTQTGQDIDTET